MNRHGNALPSAPPAEETTMRMRFRRWLLRPVLNYLKETVMPELDNINAALDALTTSVTTQLTAIQTEIAQLASAGGATPEQLQAVVDRITALQTSIDQSTAELGADDPAPTP